MPGVEASNVDVNHNTWIVQTELEPIVISKICVESLKSSSIIILIETGIVVLTSWYMGNVGLPVDIRRFNYPPVV